MGGKTKQSQRTKNNVRPSSSGRSAELLTNSIKMDPFVTAGGGHVLPVLFPTSHSTNIDQGLPAEYLVCFKKFNKKDPVTKTKALQELTELIKTGNIDDAISALPSWVHYYQTLSIDTDRRVREAAQACHGALVAACGRRIAPHLKRLLPVWLLAQHDEHAPAALLAQLHLQNTFPEGKFPEALSFCKSEIITLIVDNLSGNVEPTLSKKVEDPEEKEIQLNRVLSSSLRAAELFIMNLPKAHDDWLWEALDPLLQSSAFWKLPVHTSQHVRAAWYGASGRVVERFGARATPELRRRVARALVAAPERSAAVSVQRWAAVLLLVHNVEDWHTWLEKKDLLIKRLLDVLENAGWGEARPLANMLLPLLAKMPPDLLTKDFYTNFFNAIFTGLDNKNLLNSKSERQTWISNLEECLRYLSAQPRDFVPELVTGVHRTWLERALCGAAGPAGRHLIERSATNMATLVKFWLKHSEDESEKYDQLVRNFWQNLCSTALAQIDRLSVEPEEITRTINSHVALLKTLKAAFSNGPKRKLGIKFEDQTVAQDAGTVDDETVREGDAATERFRHNLDDTVGRICCGYFDFAYKKQMSPTVFAASIALLVEFDSRKIFLAAARHFERDTVFGFYDGVLKTWLAGDTMRCKEIAEIVFLALKYMTEEERRATFDTFQQFPPSVVVWCISLALSRPHRALEASARWMRGPVVEAGVLQLCRRDDDAGARALLLACVTRQDDGEIAIGEATLGKVIGVVRSRLDDAADEALERRATLAVELTRALGRDALRRGGAALVRELFRVDLRAGREHEGAWGGVRAAWRDALPALAPEERAQFVQSALEDVYQYLFRYEDRLDFARIAHAAKICPGLLVGADDAGSCAALQTHTREVFRALERRRPAVSVEVFALMCDTIHGNLNCPLDDDNEHMKTVVRYSDKRHAEMTRADCALFVTASLFRAVYASEAVGAAAGARELDETLRHFREELGRVLHDFVVVRTLYDRYAFWPHYDIIRETKRLMESIIECILKKIPPESVKKYSNYLSTVAATEGYYWSFAWKFFDAKIDEMSSRKESDGTLESPKRLAADDRQTADQSIADLCDTTENLAIDSKETPEVCEDNTDEFNLQKLYQVMKKVEDRIQGNVEEEPDDSRQWTEHLGLPTLEEVVTGSGFFHSLQAEMERCSEAPRRLRVRYMVMMRSLLCAHAYEPEVVLQLLSDIVEAQERLSPDPVMNAYYKQEHVLLFERNLRSPSWAQIMSNAAVVDFMSELVATRGLQLPSRYWDFVTIALCSLAASLQLTADDWDCASVAATARATSELLASVREVLQLVGAEAKRRQLPAHVLALPTEWADVFAPDVNRHLFEFILAVLRSSDRPMTASGVATIDSLVSATEHMDWEQLPAALRNGELRLQRVAAVATRTLRDTAHHAYKYLAYFTLKLVAQPLVLEDEAKMIDWNDNQYQDPRPEVSLAYFDAAIVHLQELMDAALSNVELGAGSCEMVPFSDSHCVSLSYLLLWQAVLHLCSHSRWDLALFYVERFKDKQYANCLMSSALRLLPADVAAFAFRNSATPQQHLHCFTSMPHLDPYAPCDGGTVGALACYTLTEALDGATGAGARRWCAGVDARVGAALRRLLPATVSPELLRRHLRTLKDRACELTDAQVTIQWSRAEVQCALQLEERRHEVTVRFARDHPLSPPQISCPANAPAPHVTWLVQYLNHQNGTLLNALKLWIRAVSARLANTPQCYICYSRLHHATSRPPSVLCHQCKNKYHSACLRKWFSTSGKTNCPLCRTQF